MGAPRGREPPFRHSALDFFSETGDGELEVLASLEFLSDMLKIISVSVPSYGCILASGLMYNYGAQKRRLSQSVRHNLATRPPHTFSLGFGEAPGNEYMYVLRPLTGIQAMEL